MDRRLHNFNSGPSVLPLPVLEAAQAALHDFSGTGMSVLEIYHRIPQWAEVMDDTRRLWKELLHIPDTHEVIFFSGGASMGFLLAPLNFLRSRGAAYLETGSWARKAFREAAALAAAFGLPEGSVRIAASSSGTDFDRIPDFEIPSDADYFHITTNNTIYGTEIKSDITSPVPLIADMSSDILSRPVDVSRYAMIYGGAQKNAGIAGISWAIVRRDLLGRTGRYIPTMLDLRTYVDNGSMFNTPAVFPIFVMHESLKWLSSQGGVETAHSGALRKGAMLYDEIDRNSLFVGTAVKKDRSITNVRFVMAPGRENLRDEFISFAHERDIVGIAGHRTVGGFRASVYNAQREESVASLVKCMKEFEEKYG